MKSATQPSFWSAYARLDESVKRSSRKTNRLWTDNPSHPSLNFDCINREESVWSVRITRSYRAIGIFEDDTVTWFWIGRHDAYERFFS